MSITRGALLVGLRTHHHEVIAWLFSTLAFAALHAPNAFFGQSVGATASQLVTTFLVGSVRLFPICVVCAIGVLLKNRDIFVR